MGITQLFKLQFNMAPYIRRQLKVPKNGGKNFKSSNYLFEKAKDISSFRSISLRNKIFDILSPNLSCADMNCYCVLRA